MDQTKRLILFVVISTAFIFGWNALFPPVKPSPAPPAAAARAAAAAQPRAASALVAPAGALAQPERFVTVRSPVYEYRFSTRGATLNAATLRRYVSYVKPGDQVQLVPRSARDVLGRRVVVGRDTLDFTTVPFVPSESAIELAEGSGPRQLRFVSANPGPVRMEITYTFRPDDYLVDVAGRFTGLPAGAKPQLVTELGTGMAAHDALDHGSARELAAVGWNGDRVERIALRTVQGADTVAGPLPWAGIKDRYFLIALVNDGAARFSRLELAPAPDVKYVIGGDTAQSYRARVRTVQPLAGDGTFRQEAYLGSLEHARLTAVGHELEEVNPYGYRWLRPVVRPIAALVLWLLNAMHNTLGLHYGWVLVLFGVAVRLVTWPLNARAMRSQMKNMAVQPELQARMKELQDKYRDDPMELNRRMKGVYEELGVNPLSMMTGCLPLLIPWPVMITLFFVFQGAIEFRGVSFLWLPDLSLRDPWHVLPVFLVLSMFGLQYVSTKMSGMEQNEQTRMMMYTMPLVTGFIFFAMPSGLNLYYAATNIASLPQQVLIARERRRAMEAAKAEKAAKVKVKDDALKRIPGNRKRR